MIISLVILALVIWINRVNLLVWGLPFVVDTTRPVAENIEVNWPDGPSDDEKIVTNKPNIILILADDLGFNDISLYNGGAGDGTLMTPNIDRIGKEGVIFNKGYAASASCSPSRASTMTGRYSTRFGYEFTPYFKIAQTFAQWVNDIDDPILKSEINKDASEEFVDLYSTGMSPEEITIAEVLKNEGYYSAHIGKWHLGHKKEYLPLQHGFDYYYGIPYSNDMDRINGETCCPGSQYWQKYENKKPKSLMYNVPIIENNEIIERPADQTTITKRFSDKAIEFIKENKKNKFFIYLAHSLPHTPLYTSDEFLGKSKRGLYGDVIEEIDHGVGLIIDELKKNNLDKNTIIIFTSDNGPWLPFESHSGSAGLLREGKGTTWEGGQRVPGIFGVQT